MRDPRVAVIGCGHWGKNLVRTFSELGALVAIVDPDAENAAALSAKYSVPYGSLEQILADPEIDAVVVAAPAKDHAAVTLQALDAGKHVFVEKPLALDLDGSPAAVPPSVLGSSSTSQRRRPRRAALPLLQPPELGPFPPGREHPLELRPA